MNSTKPLDCEIVSEVKKLDDIAFRAVIVTMSAMVAGFDNETALEAGNRVLTAAGRKPITYGQIKATQGKEVEQSRRKGVSV